MVLIHCYHVKLIKFCMNLIQDLRTQMTDDIRQPLLHTISNVGRFRLCTIIIISIYDVTQTGLRLFRQYTVMDGSRKRTPSWKALKLEVKGNKIALMIFISTIHHRFILLQQLAKIEPQNSIIVVKFPHSLNVVDFILIQIPCYQAMV